MDSIITYLLTYNQYLIKIIFQLLWFISKNIPLGQFVFDDSNSPEYQKFKLDRLPTIIKFEKVDYQLLLGYYHYKYNKVLKPISRRNNISISNTVICPKCGAPHEYIYNNNGTKGQYLCKVCSTTFKEYNYVSKIAYKCPYCGKALSKHKERKSFNLHKCTNSKCSYYLKNLKALPKNIAPEDKYKYKLHYLYREFHINFFKMKLYEPTEKAIGFNFKKFNPHILGLCLTYHVNLKLSTRQTSHALAEIHGIQISHTQIATYAKVAAQVIKPFVDTFDYKPSTLLVADETYIKVKGIKHYIWFIMDACKKSIIGYQVSDTRSVGPCILAMRMAFDKFKDFKNNTIKFVADGYTAYPLAKQQFELEKNMLFNLVQVIGLTNDDPVSTNHRWIKQTVERLNRTFKSSYRVTCGYGSEDGALYGVTLWVAYYNFLRPHPYNYWRPLNELKEFDLAENMPAKWQILLRLGQETILNMESSNCV
ncbi:MAG: IS6 family transposase [Cetobacterium sp.]|uniref:IS6 family transposase n=1 Tax=Cetobacterium sp. TaxID=2071632 RepID=UPI003F3AAAAE